MGKTILLGTTLAVLFTVFMIAPALAGGHIPITEAEVDDDEVEIEVALDIPTDGTGMPGDFGFGAFTTTDLEVVVVATHGGLPGADSDSQDDASDPVFHSHLVTLIADGSECPFGDGLFEIASITPEEVADFEVDDNEVEIENIDEELNGVVVSFILTAADGEVCVEVVSLIDTGDDDDDDDDDD